MRTPLTLVSDLRISIAVSYAYLEAAEVATRWYQPKATEYQPKATELAETDDVLKVGGDSR